MYMYVEDGFPEVLVPIVVNTKESLKPRATKSMH